jgi:hypothetical protein
MTIPNAANCVVELEKVRDYLLNLSHPAGKSKAVFFTAMGFRQQEGEVLAAALRQMVCRFPLTISMTSHHGQKYIVDGTLVTPIGQVPLVRTVWVIDSGADRPRLITAYRMDQEPRS